MINVLVTITIEQFKKLYQNFLIAYFYL